MAVRDVSDELLGATGPAINATDVLDDVRDALEPAGVEGVEAGLKQAADALFDRAHRAGDRGVSARYHAQMRQLHESRQAVIQRFRARLTEVFQAGAITSDVAAGGQEGTAGCVAGEDVDAIEASAARLRESHRAALAELERRLGHVLALHDRPISPCDPLAIMRSLGAAMREIGLEADLQRVVFTSVEKQLRSTLEGVYQTLNLELNAAGLTADATVSISVSTHASAEVGAVATTPASPSPAPGTMPSAGRRSANVVDAPFESADDGRTNTHRSAAATTQHDELMRELPLIPVRSWFEFINSRGKREQARLQARMDDGKRYVFGDLAGNKVAEYSLNDLARAVAAGLVLPVEDRVAVEDDSAAEAE